VGGEVDGGVIGRGQRVGHREHLLEVGGAVAADVAVEVSGVDAIARSDEDRGELPGADEVVDVLGRHAEECGDLGRGHEREGVSWGGGLCHAVKPRRFHYVNASNTRG